jgi:soluble lytic murein transglycosylase-like protein
MNGRTILPLLVLLAPCRALADAVPVPSVLPANAACRQAITAAERAHGIPPHLLAAVARVESGRRDDASGSFNPWPWTINVDGQGSFYDSKAQAVAAAASMRQRATKSIDIGCMQISLTYHPDAFPDMGSAFDPASNANYGATFLAQLYEKTGSWPKAVEMYHSATPEIGQEYGRRVYAAWPQEQRLAEATEPYPVASTAGTWASPVGHSTLFAPLRQGAPHIIPQMAGLGGSPPFGRSLDAYRSASVRFAFRTP